MNGKPAFLRVRSVLILTLTLCLSLLRITPAQAGGEVTTCTENGLDAATIGGGLITFNCGGHHSPATISINGTFTISGNVTIDGSNGGNPVTLDALGSTRIFSVTNGADLTLTNLTLSNGSTTGDGGCVYTNSELQLNNVELRQCQAISSGSHGGALYVDSAGSAELVNSSVHDNAAGYAGGGVYSLGELTLSSSYLAHNVVTTTDGGGIWAIGYTSIDGSTFYSNTAVNGYGGGIYNQGVLTVTNSMLNANYANQGGGGIQTYLGTTSLFNVMLSGNSGLDGGGLLNNQGALALTQVTLGGNSAEVGGGLDNAFGLATVTNSTVSGNSAGVSGGGLDNFGGSMTVAGSSLSGNSAQTGGGIINYRTLTVTNSTLNANYASQGGGGIDNIGTLETVTNSTLSGNLAQNGGGIYNAGATLLANVTLSNSAGMTGTANNLYLASGVLTLTNSIVSSNAPAGLNCFGAGSPKLVSGGHNLASDTSCALTGELQPSDPMLAPLTYNGGARTGVAGDPLLTHMPRAGSPVIDAIPNGTNGCGTTLTTDQRGAPRPLPANGNCDIGAVEVGWVYPQLWLALIRR